MNAARLRQAALMLRERAEAATPGPWRVDDHFAAVSRMAFVVPDRPDPRHYVSCGGGIDIDTDAAFIATMHPGVGLALARVLEQHADTYDCLWEGTHCAATALADLILGDQP